MAKKIVANNRPQRIQQKKLGNNIINNSNGMNDYKMNLIQNNQRVKPKVPINLAKNRQIQNTIPAKKGEIKLNPKYTFNLNGISQNQNTQFQKKHTTQRSYTKVQKNPPNLKYVYGQTPKTTTYRPGGSFTTRTYNYNPSENTIKQPYVSKYPMSKETNAKRYSQKSETKNPLYVPRTKSGTYQTGIASGNSWKNKNNLSRYSNSSRVSQQSRSSNNQMSRSPGGNQSILTARKKSPNNPLNTHVFLDTSMTAPRKIRLPNSSKPKMLEGRQNKMILNKAKFFKKSSKKISANILNEGSKVPSKTKFNLGFNSKEMRESRTRITNRIINTLVSENKQIEKEYRATSRIKKKEELFKHRKAFQIPELNTSRWYKIDQININNINSFGLDKHDRFPTGHKFSLNNHVSNEGNENPNWLMSKYKQFFGKEQYKNSEFNIPKELKNYKSDYLTVRPVDLKKLLVKEQIRDNFDHYLLTSLMNWTPQSHRISKELGDSFDRMEADKIFGNSVQVVRRKNQTKIKSVYWKQREIYTDPNLNNKAIQKLKKKMKDAKETLSIIKISARRTRFEKRDQEINFSPEEIKRIFQDSNFERMAFFFKKYRGILVNEDIDDNVLFIENQLHGVEDQLNTMMFEQRTKNKGKEKLFQTDTAVSYTHLTLPTICSV